MLVVFISEAIRTFGPRNCLLAGILAMAAAAVAIGRVDGALAALSRHALLAFGWAGTSLGVITNTLGLWFDKKRGMAISLALNGASFGGIVGVPLLVAAIGLSDFPAPCRGCGRDARLMVPIILISSGGRRSAPCGRLAAAPSPSPRRYARRRCAMSAFLTVSIAFALVLFAQVGFIVHLIAFLDPVIGRDRPATAVALLTAMAVAGRVLFSTVIDRLNQRLASAISFVSQAVALRSSSIRATKSC